MKSPVCLRPLKTITVLILILRLVKATSSSGCGTKLANGSSAGGQSQYMTIESGGNSRSYLLYIPTNYKINTTAPLILNYHGGMQVPQNQEELSQMSNSEFNKNSIVAYPQGINDSWEGDPGQPSSINDIEFTSDLIQFLSSNNCIDNTRIYATGISDGAGFLGLLACDPVLSTIITAFAPVAGAFYSQTPGASCSPGRTPVPIMEFHGSDDTVIPYGGGVRKGLNLPSIPSWLQSWAMRDGDGSANTTSEQYNGNVAVSTWTESNKAVAVGYLVTGMGHTWPSTLPNLDSSVGTFFNATPVIMDFFANYPAPSPSPPTTSSSSLASSTASPTTSPAASTTASATPHSQGNMICSVDIQAAIIAVIGSVFASMLI